MKKVPPQVLGPGCWVLARRADRLRCVGQNPAPSTQHPPQRCVGQNPEPSTQHPAAAHGNNFEGAGVQIMLSTGMA